MDKLLYVAMSGASQNQMAMQAHANNLANVSTTGFHKDLEQARSMQIFGDSYPTRVYAMSERPATDFSGGALQQTGRALDVSVQGEGWMAVQAANGGEAYVRTGHLEIDPLGVLRTDSGLPVLGNGGLITVPPKMTIEIGQDGTVSIRGDGQNTSVLAQIDRLKLVNPDPKQLEKGADGLVRMAQGQAAPKADANIRVVSGFTEASNVNAAEEMTSILELSRQFELHIKMMRAAEDNSAAMDKVLQIA